MGDRTRHSSAASPRNAPLFVWINRIYTVIDVLWIAFYAFLGYRLWAAGSFLHAQPSVGFMGLQSAPLWLFFVGVCALLILYLIARVIDRNVKSSRKELIVQAILNFVCLIVAPAYFALIIMQGMK